MKRPEACTTLEEVRAEIDQIDHEIVEALALRRQYVGAAMRFKRTESDVHAPERQAQVIAARRQWAGSLDLSPDLVEKLFRTLIEHFVAEEMALLAQRSHG